MPDQRPDPVPTPLHASCAPAPRGQLLPAEGLVAGGAHALRYEAFRRAVPLDTLHRGRQHWLVKVMGERRPNTVRRAPSRKRVAACKTAGIMKTGLRASRPRERTHRTRRPERSPSRRAGGPGRVREPGMSSGAGSSTASPLRQTETPAATTTISRPRATTHRGLLKAAVHRPRIVIQIQEAE